jgi:hypothetical protein
MKDESDFLFPMLLSVAATGEPKSETILEHMIRGSLHKNKSRK